MKTNFSTGLIVAFSKGLINFVFNRSTGTYEKKAEGQAKIIFPQNFSFSDSQFGKIIDMCPYS